MMSCNSMGFCGNGCNDSLRHVEQIALNKGAVDCLNGRVCRNEAEIRDRYTKSELDRMLEGKLDKCSFEKHFIKCGGSGSCDCADIPQVCDCDCYTKTEIDELLENKINKTQYEYLDFPYNQGYESNSGSYYWKNTLDLVGVVFSVKRTDGNMPIKSTIGVLPVGFRPRRNVLFTGTCFVHDNAGYTLYRQPAPAIILESGEIEIYTDNEASHIEGSIIFPAVQ